MTAKQVQEGFPELQEAIYRVALSLDAFLVNGIPYGVLQRAVFSGFVEKTAGILLSELANLETQVARSLAASQHRVAETLAALRAKCQQLIDLVGELISFRSLPLEQMRSTVSQIPLLHEECVQLINELEACLQTSKPFYQSRRADLTAAMNDFLANIEQLFIQERTASRSPERSSVEEG